jgi:hypothetical protein
MADKCHQETMRKLFLDKQRGRHALVPNHATATLQCSLDKDFGHWSSILTVDLSAHFLRLGEGVKSTCS